MKRFSEDHLWVDVSRNGARVGITAYASEELGEISFIELPETGAVLTQGETLCVMESIKAAQDVVAPLSGTVAEVNLRLENEPELLNSGPETDGWICQLTELEDDEIDELMTEQEYEAYIAADAEDGDADEDDDDR